MPAWVPDLLGTCWVLAAAAAALGPALAKGASLGPFDLLSLFGLTRQPGIAVHNGVNGDQIQQMIPWTTVVWDQVHQGHLPLWNPYGLLGMPLAFNWQSAPFSLPALIGYLVPVHLAYTVEMVTKLVIAGTGVYFLSRMLSVGPLCSAFAGTVFMLSGPMMGWLGWPLTSAMVWAGWLFAATLLVLRGRRRAPNVAFLAVVIAFSIYGGSPESVILLGMALFVFLAVLFVFRVSKRSGALLRPTVDVMIGALAGSALAAPLLLPGLQLISGSARSTESSSLTLPPHELLNLVFQSYNGLPLLASQWFDSVNYYESAAYVGVIGLAFAVVAVGVRWRRPEVTALAAVAVVMGAVAFFPPLTSLLRAFPNGKTVIWTRAMMPLTFALAVLAGIGLDALVRTRADRRVRHWAGVTLGLIALGLGALVLRWVWHGLPPPPALEAQLQRFYIRAQKERFYIRGWSFAWPVAEVAAGLVVVGVLTLYHRRTRDRERTWTGLSAGSLAGLTLLLVETAFLVTVAAPLWSSSAQFFKPTPDVAALQRAVGSSTVGFSSCTGVKGYPGVLSPAGQIQSLGILPDANAGFNVRELAAIDPLLPNAYYRSWSQASGQKLGTGYTGAFCPAITSASLARRYGVAFVLEPGGAPPLPGGAFDMKVGDEGLYRIPGAAPATLTPAALTGTLPAANAVSTPLWVTHPNPATWKLLTSSDTPQVLRVRLNNVPGWHSTIDGRPLPLEPFSTVMLQARIPPGRHTVELHYWPRTFTLGIVLAACSAAGLTIAMLIGRKRRGHHVSPANPTTEGRVASVTRRGRGGGCPS